MGIFLTEQWGWYCLVICSYCMLGACKTIVVWLGFVVLVTLLLLCLADMVAVWEAIELIIREKGC